MTSADEREDRGGAPAERDEDAPGQASSDTDKKAADKDDKDDPDKDDKRDGDKADEPHLYQRPLFWIILIGVVLVLAIGGLLWWLHARRFVSTDDAFVDTHIVRIAAQTNGRLTEVPFTDNRHVEPGQLLAVIEPGTPEASRDEALAGVAQADAGIKQAEAKVLSAIASLRKARADALAPAADAGRYARDYARYRNLKTLDGAAVAATQLDQARAQAESAAAQALAARRQIGTATADVASARKEVEAQVAQRKAALARVRSADVTVSYLRIKAPLAGQVVNRSIAVGSYVAPGQQLMALVPDHMWVTANFKETQLANMRLGQHVDIKLDAYPGATLSGHIDSIQRGAGQAFQLLPAQNATGNYVKVVQRVPVRIEFDGDEWRHYVMGPGMSVVPRVTVRP